MENKLRNIIDRKSTVITLSLHLIVKSVIGNEFIILIQTYNKGMFFQNIMKFRFLQLWFNYNYTYI